MSKKEHVIPTLTPLEKKVGCDNCEKCKNCDFSRSCRKKKSSSSTLKSQYDCTKNMEKINLSKVIVFSLTALGFLVFYLVNFTGFWRTTGKLFLTLAIIAALDFCTDLLLKIIFEKLEKKRVATHNSIVNKLKVENEAIRRENLGITDEVQNFYNNAENLYNNLSEVFENIQKKLSSNNRSESNEYITINNKMIILLNELKDLNEKLLSPFTLESKYLGNFYRNNLPKLLDHSYYFLNNLSTNLLTQKQISEFINLLDLFINKLGKFKNYFQNEVESDFLNKLNSLSSDITSDSE